MLTNFMATISKANADFALKLHRGLSAGQASLVYSPYSVTLALALLHAGAAGRTRDELEHALGFGGIGDDLHRGLSEIGSLLEVSRQTQIAIASNLWRQQGIRFEREYLEIVKQSYGVTPAELDFRNAPTKASQEINEWVRKRTHGLISRIMSALDIRPHTQLYLANAVYFKARWHKPFKSELTKPKDFQCMDGNSAHVDMMHQRENLFYWASDELQATALPYEKNGLRFVIVLPRLGLFSAVDQSIDAAFFDRILFMEGNSRNVHLGLPRFKIRCNMRLRAVLSDMGINALFGPAAELSRMSATSGLQLEEVRQVAHISVDEAGTEAAAVTHMSTVLGIGEELEPVEMIVDRPFLFFIVDMTTRTVLFAGRMLRP